MRWKKALFAAGNLSGWHLNDGDESELIQGIVKFISTQLSRTPLHVADYPVGIDSQVVKLRGMLNLESTDDVLMMGLWGQGGIGKTTLAKAIYNDIFRLFEGSSFLAHVRENSKGYEDLVALQEILLNDILLPEKRLEVSNVDGGKKLIQQRLGRKRVLVVLDDVDCLRQLGALAGKDKWFGDGSRIIVTTRDSHMLTSHEIYRDRVYEVTTMNDGEAHELLSKHAFPPHQKLKIRTDLVNGVLNHAKGLPLALEVLGSFLHNRGEAEWDSTLRRLSKFPNKTINDVLKISYIGLEEDHKEIFLHIACFFKGWEIGHIYKVLNSCDFKATIGVKVLYERSLIKIESRTLQMHDLIQSMGMDIAKQKCDDLRRQSRLWLYEDVVDILSSNMGDCDVKAIVLNPPEPVKISVNGDAFTKLRRLTLLILRNVSFQGPICLPNEIRWLEWPDAPQFPEFASGPKKLVSLDLRNGTVTIVPKSLDEFRQLKYINFSSCNSLVHMPDISCAPNLEKLNLLGAEIW
ncbi:disease resistance protein RUN1-like isoform X2 [Eucalyptus grandis]|uniref:disease resistance protein RUN1-like isoform X2 n=1 Tax=Eucalyptus grandis TaxID=71139 RepID=UPI00192E884F|nr:disease resistance protein RUN1-like isoform X2 [Eucalyptus grandis]